jgi:hypothetical protein
MGNEIQSLGRPNTARNRSLPLSDNMASATVTKSYRKRSSVHSQFEYSQELGLYCCKICPSGFPDGKVKAPSGSTTNLWRHLSDCHVMC